jgi:hypothetical protein
VAGDSKVDFIPRVQHPDFGSLGRRLPFVGLSLPEIGNCGGLLPRRIVERSVHAWRMIDADGLGNPLCGLCAVCRRGPRLLPEHPRIHDADKQQSARELEA